MSTIWQSMNDFIELAKEEAECALASEWDKLEKEMTELREAYQKIKHELTTCKAKLEMQVGRGYFSKRGFVYDSGKLRGS